MFPPNYFGPQVNPSSPTQIAAAVWGDAATYGSGTKADAVATALSGIAALLAKFSGITNVANWIKVITGVLKPPQN